MSSHELTKKCPYDGCNYLSKAATTHALEHNVSTHVSNSHRGITHVWYGGSKVTIHRDVKSNSFICPCGEYSNSNAASVRRHATNVHKNMSTAISAPRASKPAVASKADEDGMYHVLDLNPKNKLHVGGGEFWVPTGPTVVNKAYPLVAITPMGPPGKSISVRASAPTSAGSSSKGASSAISKSIASTSASVARPLPTPASTVGPSTTRSVSSKRKVEEPTPGPSKIRRVGGARSVSASNAVASSSKTDVRISAPKPLFTFVPMEPKTSAVTSSGSASTSKKRPSDEGLPGPSSAKMQRLSGWPTVGERKAAKPAKLTQSVAPLKVPDPSSRNTAPTKENEKKKAHTSQRSVGNASSVSATASAATAPTPVKGTPKPRPVVKPGSLVQPQPQAKPRTESKKHVRPAPAAGVAASSASSGFSTSTRGSSSSSSARTSATPASDRAGPSARGPSKRTVTNCRDCGGWIDPHGKNGMCTMCCVESLPAAPAPAPAVPPQRCATCGHKWTGKGAECTKCQLKALAHSSPPKDGKKDASAPQPAQKPPRKRVSKKMRQREFGRWFARWTAAHRAATDAAEGGDEDKTDWWRVETTRNQGGVCYPTPEAFFAALEDALVRYRESAKDNLGEKEGKGGVLTFYGGYSIVAQPKISAMARLDKLVGRMEEIGFRLDSALQGYMKFRYRSAGGTMDEVYKYPCTCGGAPPPVAENEMRHAHRIPDEKYAGEVCGGTIMLMVGEDNARLAYGIQGQRIAVDIVH